MSTHKVLDFSKRKDLLLMLGIARGVLGFNRSIEQIDFSDNAMTDEILEGLIPCLKKHKNIKALFLSRIFIKLIQGT